MRVLPLTPIALPVLAIAAGLCGLLLVPALAGAQTADAAPPAIGPLVAAAPGLIEPASEEREIASDLRGTLKAVHVDEGDRVTTDQVVAVLDNTELQARLAAARAQVRLREGERDRLVNGARLEERREVEATLHEAEADLALARQTFSRRLRLVETQAGSAEALDQARATLDAAEARRAAVFQRYTLINLPPRPEDVTIAEARLAMARAEEAEAQALLDRSFIRSPIDGTVLRRMRRAGEAVSDQPPTPILRIGDLSHLRVRAEIDETDIAQVKPGQRAYVTAETYGKQQFWGTISRVGTRMGRKTIQTERAAERVDTQVLEVLIDLDPGTAFPIGLRVDVFIGRADA